MAKANLSLAQSRSRPTLPSNFPQQSQTSPQQKRSQTSSQEITNPTPTQSLLRENRNKHRGRKTLTSHQAQLASPQFRNEANGFIDDDPTNGDNDDENDDLADALTASTNPTPTQSLLRENRNKHRGRKTLTSHQAQLASPQFRNEANGFIDDDPTNGDNDDENDDLADALTASLLLKSKHESDSKLIDSAFKRFWGLTRVKMNRDGLCMFHALANLAKDRVYIDGEESIPFVGNHLAMRELLVEYIYKNWRDFKNSIVTVLTSSRDKAYNAEQTAEKINNRDDYRQKMLSLSRAEWGGPCEMRAFEKIFNVMVYIVRPTEVGLALYANQEGWWLQECNLDNNEMSSREDREVDYTKNPNNVFVYHADMNHYDVLVPTDAGGKKKKTKKRSRLSSSSSTGGEGGEKDSSDDQENFRVNGLLNRFSKRFKSVLGGKHFKSAFSKAAKIYSSLNKGKNERKKKADREARIQELCLKEDRFTTEEIDFLIGVLEMDTSNEMGAAISELLKKLKDALQKSGAAPVSKEGDASQKSGAAPVSKEGDASQKSGAAPVSKEEDEVADFTDPSNEGKWFWRHGVNGKPRVAMLVSAISSKTGLLEKKTDWNGPMKEAYLENHITMILSGDLPTPERAMELIWEAGGARHPKKALLVDIDMDVVDYSNEDEWLVVDTKFDVDYINATVSGRVAADLLCSYLGNHKVSHHQKLDGVDEKVLRATVGDNVVICMTHRDARAFQKFCWLNGRLLPTCLNRGGPVKFFGLTRKSIPDGVLREFLCRDGLFVRIVGYGMNMRLDERGLTVLKRLSLGQNECEARALPPDLTTEAMKDEYKKALWKPMHMDFSWVTPTNGVGKEEKEARLVRMKKKEGVAGRGHNQYQHEVYPVCGGDGRNSGTVRLRNCSGNPPTPNRRSEEIERKHPWVKKIDQVLNYGNLQVHGLNQMGTKLSTSLNGKRSINGLKKPVVTMVNREAATAQEQLNPSSAFGVRGEARARKSTLDREDFDALIYSHRNWSNVRATMEDLGWTFEDVAVYDKLEKVARLSLQTMQLYSGISNSKAVNDDEPNCFKIVMRMRMQTAARCILNTAGTIISARNDDSQYSRDPFNPNNLLRITDLGTTLVLSDFELSKVGLAHDEHGNKDSIKAKVKTLLVELKTRHGVVDLVKLANQLFEMGNTVEPRMRSDIINGGLNAAVVVEEWVVDALVERIIIESAEKQLSEVRVAKMLKWTDKKKAEVESIHKTLDDHTELDLFSGGKHKINNYYLMRQNVKKPTNDTGRGGNTGGQVSRFKLGGKDVWGDQWLDWSKKNKDEPAGQKAEHHWQLAEYIFENGFKDTYVAELMRLNFWRE